MHAELIIKPGAELLVHRKLIGTCDSVESYTVCVSDLVYCAKNKHSHACHSKAKYVVFMTRPGLTV